MRYLAEAETLTQRELVEMWCVAFGEPPPLVHDPVLMISLIEAELLIRSKPPPD